MKHLPGAVVVALWCLAPACGKPAAKTPVAEVAAEPDPAPTESGELIAPEKLEAVNTLLARKRFSTSRCVQAAQDGGELKPSQSVKISLSFMVGTAGKAHSSRVVSGAGTSKILETCLIEFIEGLQFEALPRDVEFSQTYYFAGV